MLVSASVLSADFSKLAEELQKVEKAGADWIHLDVMDGHFVPNLTFGAPVITRLRAHSNLIFDVHLMIDHPENLIEDFLAAGADMITIHIEATDKVAEIITKIKLKGKKVGLSIRPKTPLEKIQPWLSQVDMILVMTVEPGFGGQAFMPETIPRITQVKTWRSDHLDDYQYQIQVDGGINEKTVHAVKNAGADCVVAGSYIFKQKDYAVPVKFLHDA